MSVSSCLASMGARFELACRGARPWGFGLRQAGGCGGTNRRDAGRRPAPFGRPKSHECGRVRRPSAGWIHVPVGTGRPQDHGRVLAPRSEASRKAVCADRRRRDVARSLLHPPGIPPGTPTRRRSAPPRGTATPSIRPPCGGARLPLNRRSAHAPAGAVLHPAGGALSSPPASVSSATMAGIDAAPSGRRFRLLPASGENCPKGG
jgi:hypothetical protein